MSALMHGLAIGIAIFLAAASIRRFQHSVRRPLLPEGAYVAGGARYSNRAQRRIDDAVALRMHLIPTSPGQWYDREGAIWSLGEDQRWTDPRGETRGPEWTPLLGLYAPWSPVPPQTTTSITDEGA